MPNTLIRKPTLVAELGLNHNGEVSLAKAMIQLAAENGIDYVKFQKRNPELTYTQEYLDKPRKSRWGKTARDEKRGLEFGREEFDEIAEFCRGRDIGWFASVWDIESVEFMLPYEPEFFKVASACLTNIPLLEAIRATNVPVIMSTGMSTEEEVAAAVKLLGRDSLMYLLHCVALYPCPDQEMRMSDLQRLQGRYGGSYGIGFSNHSPKILYCLQAACMRVEMIEFHITLSHDLPGPDHKSSLGPADVARLVGEINSVCNGWGYPGGPPLPEELTKGKHYLWRA